jgi:precorrin-3B C17-methyltransferase
MSGWIAVAGLGPGSDALITPEVSAALDQATDIVGYIPYVARVGARDGMTLHPSDNRVELDRARLRHGLGAVRGSGGCGNGCGRGCGHR